MFSIDILLNLYDKYLADYYKSLETKRCSCKNVISGYCVTDILKWTYL